MHFAYAQGMHMEESRGFRVVALILGVLSLIILAAALQA